MSSANLPARERALHRLLRIEQQGAYVSRVSGADTDADDAREERQAAEYVAGITRMRRWLDFLIESFYHGAAAEMEPALRQVLRIGIYDLLVLDTPPHAAVSQGVALARRAVRPEAAGLVNGLLRTVDRQRHELPVPASGRAVRDMAVTYSQPNWIVRRWLGRYGPEGAQALLAAANVRPRYGLRVNTLRLSRVDFGRMLDEVGVEWEESPYLDDFVRVARLQAVLRAGWLEDGTCAVQDEAAGLVVRILDPRPGEFVIDAAAAPGGKATYAAIRMRDSGRLLAIDVHEARADLIRSGAAAHGLHSVEVVAADVRDVGRGQTARQADRVLLDAPCSGLGVLAKRADLRWQRSEEDLPQLCALQDDLLDAVAGMVRPGGLLVYSTCSIEPDENEERVATFLERQPGFSAESVEGHVPETMLTAAGHFLSLPHRDGIDGAFAARLRRTA
jgi:16S rRNA (cytosine967-C5)-methyltransferase